MKKVKNSELNSNDLSLEHIKEGKVKKTKQKKDKNLSKTESLNLAPKNVDTNLKPINDGSDKTKKFKKNKSSNLKKLQVTAKEQDIVGNNECDSEELNKQKISKNNKVEQECDQENNSAKILTDGELKKIEKKKAKKLAQKLKKVQRKAENESQHKTSVAFTNSKQKTMGSVTSTTKNFELKNSKLLTKKENRAQKRQLIKEEKLAGKQTRDPSMEAATIFVGNVPVNTKRIQLIRLLKDFAPVNSIRFRTAGGNILLKHKQRKSAGSLNAYIVLKDKETAENAISLNGVEFKGQHLRITLATNISQSHDKEAKRTIFIGNLKYSATEESLREIFSSCGEIDYVRCIREGDKGCKGVAYICFKKADAVGLALELNGTIVNDRPINVERYNVKKLGAKEARETQANKEDKSKKGVKQRLNNKKKEKPGHKKDNHSEIDDEVKSKKKSDFRGIKIQGLKKKDKSKKKKSNDQMLQLAKKIAPKGKTE